LRWEYKKAGERESSKLRKKKNPQIVPPLVTTQVKTLLRRKKWEPMRSIATDNLTCQGELERSPVVELACVLRALICWTQAQIVLQQDLARPPSYPHERPKDRRTPSLSHDDQRDRKDDRRAEQEKTGKTLKGTLPAPRYATHPVQAPPMVRRRSCLRTDEPDSDRARRCTSSRRQACRARVRRSIWT